MLTNLCKGTLWPYLVPNKKEKKMRLACRPASFDFFFVWLYR